MLLAADCDANAVTRSVTVQTHASFSFSIRGPRACDELLAVSCPKLFGVFDLLRLQGQQGCIARLIVRGWGVRHGKPNFFFFKKKQVHLLNGQSHPLLDCGGQA